MRGNFGRTNYVFRKAQEYTDVYGSVASPKGVANKSFLLIAVTFLASLFGIFILGPVGSMSIYVPVVIIDLVLLLIMCFKPTAARSLSIPYAILEGLMIGAISGILEVAWPGLGLAISGTAFIVTMIIFLVASVLYLNGNIRVTNKFRKFMLTATLSLILGGLVIGIMSIFNPGVAYVFSYGPIALLVSLIYIVIATLYVVISLDNAYQIVESGLGQDYEWYAAFGILLNVIWLFYEVLRFLVMILARRDD